jgi:hypothetical protein
MTEKRIESKAFPAFWPARGEMKRAASGHDIS